MERSNYRFSLDIRDSHGACLVDMKRRDTHRRLYITLTDGGVPYHLTGGCRAVFAAKKPDGKVIYNHCEVENDTVIYDVTPQTTAAPGLLECELRLYDGTGLPMPDESGEVNIPQSGVQLLTSATFGIRVHPTVYNEGDVLASADEVTELTQMTARGYQALQLLEQARESGDFDGVSATHSWEGTVLTVTSASGTSSADLRGQKGEKGEKGEKGDPGEVNMDDAAVGEGAWSGKNIVDRLCPDLAESGSVVRCEPVEGYPLEVVTELPVSEAGYQVITLTQCGKNLFDYTQTEFTNHYIFWSNRDGREGQTTSSTGYSASGYIPVSNLQGQTITLNHPPVEAAATGNAGMAFYDANKESIIGYGTNGYTAVVPDNAQYMRFSVPRAYADGTAVQIELGSAVTAFEAYREPRVFTMEFPESVSGGRYCWSSGMFADGTGSGKKQPVIGQPGGNVFYSSAGTTAVTGKADPVAVVEKLTGDIAALKNAVLSLGGNI